MQSTARLGALLLGIGSVLTFVSCSDDDDDNVGGAGQGNEGGTGNVGPEPTEGGSGGVAHGGGGHAEAPTVCRVLGKLCHESDTGSGPANECHELGHVGDAGVCEQEFDSCIATCVDSGGEGGAGGGAGDTLDPYCAALGELCHPVDGTSMGAECHDIGHLGVAADCAEAFESCGSFCLEELEKLEEAAGGAGGTGAGGAGPAAGGAGGTN